MVYAYLARTGYMRNTTYRWSHMLNNLASLVFGFLYISLWQAVAPETAAAGDPYNRATMVNMMIVAQVFAWTNGFLPHGLGIHLTIRDGTIATHMARPIPYFPMIIMREVGNVLYQFLWRGMPIAIMFAFTLGFPRPASGLSLLMTVPSLVLGSYVTMTLLYTVGITSLWTTEVRWAQWLYFTTLTLLSGGWIPADILPGWLGKVAPYLPFASQMYYPVRIYMGLSDPSGLLVQVAWAVAMTVWCLWITHRAQARIVVQGG